MVGAWHMDFGKPFKKWKSEIKYEDFYCSKIQLQRLTADKLSCFTLNYGFKLFRFHQKFMSVRKNIWELSVNAIRNNLKLLRINRPIHNNSLSINVISKELHWFWKRVLSMYYGEAEKRVIKIFLNSKRMWRLKVCSV